MQSYLSLPALPYTHRRNQYLNAQNTFRELFNLGVMPIVNENDTVATEQIRFGDNDTLSAQVANLIQADWLFLLTDVDYLYTGNPRIDPDAKPIFIVEDTNQLEVDTQTAGTQWGTGGMETKITAAVMASAAGCRTVICSSSTPESLVETIAGNWTGTVFLAQDHPLKGRRRWIPLVPPRGVIVLDSGAVRAVIQKRSSLFAVGITSIEGNFSYQDAVRICNEEGKELARCIVNYSAKEVRCIMGKHSKYINRILGYVVRSPHFFLITECSLLTPYSSIPTTTRTHAAVSRCVCALHPLLLGLVRVYIYVCVCVPRKLASVGGGGLEIS